MDGLQVSSLGRLYLAETEIDSLIALYKDPNDPDRVCWRTFEDDIDKGIFFIHCVIDLLFLFFVPVSFTVFTVKELEKLPNLKVESPPKEIEELNRKGTSDWQCQEKSKRDLCEETLLKIRYRVNERRILIKQFFKDYDRYAYFYFIAFIITRTLLKKVFF